MKNKYGFELIHFGINTPSKESAAAVSSLFETFGLIPKVGNSSTFMDSSIEIMHSMFKGSHGHIGFKCTSIEDSLPYLKEKGFTPNLETAKYDANGRLSVIYLNEEIVGFAIHLVRA